MLLRLDLDLMRLEAVKMIMWPAEGDGASKMANVDCMYVDVQS